MNPPENLKDCFDLLEEDLSIKDIIEIKGMTREQLYRLHHSLGRWIRNNWNLWTEGPLKDHMNNLGLHHPDDMSGLIIESFWHYLRKEPLEVARQIQEYKDFWKKQN